MLKKTPHAEVGTAMPPTKQHYLLTDAEKQFLAAIRKFKETHGEKATLNIAQFILVAGPLASEIGDDREILFKQLWQLILFSKRWREGDLEDFHERLARFVENLDKATVLLESLKKSGFLDAFEGVAVEVISSKN